MKPLYRLFNLSAEDAAEVMATIVELLAEKADDEKAIKTLKEKFSGETLLFAMLTFGRLLGIGLALNDKKFAEEILFDFYRLMDILKDEGREKLVRKIMSDILEEVSGEIDRFKDVV